MKLVCPQCGSKDVMVARDMKATRLCSKCGHQWLPEPKVEPPTYLEVDSDKKPDDEIKARAECRATRLQAARFAWKRMWPLKETFTRQDIKIHISVMASALNLKDLREMREWFDMEYQLADDLRAAGQKD